MTHADGKTAALADGDIDWLDEQIKYAENLADYFTGHRPFVAIMKRIRAALARDGENESEIFLPVNLENTLIERLGEDFRDDDPYVQGAKVGWNAAIHDWRLAKSFSAQKPTNAEVRPEDAGEDELWEAEGFLVVDTIANGLNHEEWSEEFRQFYKKEHWLNSRRAACGFIIGKMSALKSAPVPDGYALVPLEPTEDVLHKMWMEWLEGGKYSDRLLRMYKVIAAAPKAATNGREITLAPHELSVKTRTVYGSGPHDKHGLPETHKTLTARLEALKKQCPPMSKDSEIQEVRGFNKGIDACIAEAGKV